jgi:hypothetical protein
MRTSQGGEPHFPRSLPRLIIPNKAHFETVSTAALAPIPGASLFVRLSDRRSTIAAMIRRFAFLLFGYGVGLLVGLVILAALHKHFTGMIFGFAFSFGVLSVALAELSKKVKSPEEIGRPQSLKL